MYKLNLLLLFSFIAFHTFAQEVRVEGVNYEISPETKTAKVVGSFIQPPDGEPIGQYSGILEIPKSFQYNGVKYKVTSIGTLAFLNCDELKSVVIPNTVEVIEREAFLYSSISSVKIPTSVLSIEERAFAGCNNLRSITIPKSVTKIEAGMFYGCDSLTSITIPKTVTFIGEDAFGGCDSLTSIDIPKSVKTIESGAFTRSSIASINVDENNPDYCSVDNMLFNKARTELLFCPANLVGKYTIPNGVASIADKAFYGCGELTSIAIPTSVTNIGNEAFCGCDALSSVTIPNSVTHLGDDAFMGCSALASVALSNALDSIGNGVFYGCEELTTINMPNSVKCIGASSFRDCASLTSITIPNSVTSIEFRAFHGCSNLTSIAIPNTVMSIGDGAFGNCTSLTSVTLPASLSIINNYLFNSCTSLTSVTIPNSVTSIGDGAFYGCSGLTSVEIPNSVTSIGYEVFLGCSGLTSVTIPNSVTSIGYVAFSGCTSLSSITIPASVTDIASNAFERTSITKVEIESDAILAKEYTRKNNLSDIFGKQLNECVIGDGVSKIGKNAFYGSENLEKVSVGNSVKVIDESSFFGCKSLTNLNIPNSVMTIGDHAFEGCKSLCSIDLPKSTTVGRMAFPYHVYPNAKPEIKRSVLGLTLGVTSKQKAISILLANGVDIDLNTRKTLYLKNVNVDGQQFGFATLNFYDGIFSQIIFHEDNNSTKMSSSKHKQLVDFYTKKYPLCRYYVLKSQCVFDDDITRINITDQGGIFTDIKLDKKKSMDQVERDREIHPLYGMEIDRNVLDCTLGTSTRQQVIDALGKHGMRIVQDSYPDSITFTPVTHEGVRFSVVKARFFAGRLESLSFTNPGKGLTYEEFKALEQIFSEKYAACDMNERLEQDDSDGKNSYCDDVVGISISQNGYLGYLDGGLYYTYCELTDKLTDFDMKGLRGQKTVDPDKQYIIDLFNGMEK